jgi:hypothetical protein
LNIEIISSAVCTCVGDVMRELDQVIWLCERSRLISICSGQLLIASR